MDLVLCRRAFVETIGEMGNSLETLSRYRQTVQQTLYCIIVLASNFVVDTHALHCRFTLKTDNTYRQTFLILL